MAWKAVVGGAGLNKKEKKAFNEVVANEEARVEAENIRIENENARIEYMNALMEDFTVTDEDVLEVMAYVF